MRAVLRHSIRSRALALGLLAFAATAQADSEPAWIYVGVYVSDRPFVDYEGDAPVELLGARQPRQGADFELTLRTQRLPGQEVRDVQFDAKARRIGEERFTLRGMLQTRVPVRVQFVQMQRDGAASEETFPELAFEPGRHAIRFDGRVLGWLEQ